MESGVYVKIFVDDLERFRKLSDAEYGRLVRAELEYRATREEPVLSGRESLLWDGIKLELDRDIKRYENTKAVRSEAGQKGASARWQMPSNDSKRITPMANDNKNGLDIDIDNRHKTIDKDIDKGRGNKFRAPTLDEVREYCRERNNNVDPERFLDFYQARNWKYGNTAIKDWKACIRTWEKNEKKTATTSSNQFLNILMKEGDAL
jgi:hypothetical protein